MKFRTLAWPIVSAVVLVAVISGFVVVRRGFSARDEPSAIEKFMAGGVRGLATPRRAKELRDPVALSADVLCRRPRPFRGPLRRLSRERRQWKHDDWPGPVPEGRTCVWMTRRG